MISDERDFARIRCVRRMSEHPVAETGRYITRGETEAALFGRG
jgi:hypothetical protein